MPQPLFKRLAEIGRVALINYGPDTGKLCVIIDIIDSNRAWVDGPSDVTGVVRQSIPFKWLALTKFTVSIPKSPRLKTLRKAFEKAEISKKWEATSWSKKAALKAKRASTTDFERFQIMLARKKRALLIKDEVRKLKKTYNKEETAKKAHNTQIPYYKFQ